MSNKADANILDRAKSYHLSAKFLNPIDVSREIFDKQVSMLFKQTDVDLIVLMGYMRIISPEFIMEWKNKIINVHPSLLPLHAGKMDLDVHQAVLAAEELESGCTVHYVTEEVDAGPVILQKKCAVLPQDTPDSLKARVQALEGDALVESIYILGNR